jgi:hypothetical protein
VIEQGQDAREALFGGGSQPAKIADALQTFGEHVLDAVIQININPQLVDMVDPVGFRCVSANLYYTSGTHVGWLQQTIDLEIARTNGFGYTNGEVSAQTNALGLIVTLTRDSMDRIIETHSVNLNITNLWDKLGLASTASSGSTNNGDTSVKMVCACLSPALSPSDIIHTRPQSLRTKQ